MASPTNSNSLPAMTTCPKYIFFTDFDGTITSRDSNDYLTDKLGYGPVKRKAGNAAVLDGQSSFRAAFSEMLDSVHAPFDVCIQTVLDAIGLDPGFKEFYVWARKHNVPVVVLSSGMEPIIRALLVHLIGPEANEMRIVSNGVEPREGKSVNEEDGWRIVFRDDSHFGHDKSIEIRPYAALPDGVRPTLFYAGDGTSDLSAAKETDMLFAKKGYDLVKYCIREKVPFTEFEDWSSILATVKDIVAGNINVEQVSAEGIKKHFGEDGMKIGTPAGHG